MAGDLNQLLTDLTEAAGRATSGEWICHYDYNDGDDFIRIYTPGGHCDILMDEDSCTIEDGEYIALASPQNILRIVEALRVAREALKAHSRECWCPEQGHCEHQAARNALTKMEEG